MRRWTKALLAAFAATLVLALWVSSVLAGRIEVTEQQTRVAGEARFIGESGGGAVFTVVCSVTMDRSFHSRTISKVNGALVGYVRAVRVARPCSSGEVWALNGVEVQDGSAVPNSLPWHIRYTGFLGTLPNISALKLSVIGVSFLIRVMIMGFTQNCLYKSTEASPYRTLEFFDFTEIQEPSNRIPFFSGGICPTGLHVGGEAFITTIDGRGVHINLIA